MIEGTRIDAGILARAQGCMMGQLAGDALGSLVEFCTPEQIASKYPDGLHLHDGGTWGTIAGQPTDDSEMALMLARSIVDAQAYRPANALKAYLRWRKSEPFDMGLTIRSSLSGSHDASSQANGAMMRVSPLGIFGANFSLEEIAEWAMADASLTHVNPICRQANALFAMAIAEAVRSNPTPDTLYASMLSWAEKLEVEPALLETMRRAEHEPPKDYLRFAGWVLVAFQNALHQLLHAGSLEEGVLDTIMQGGDTDTNAAICGALLGAAHGLDAVPVEWRTTILACRPETGNTRVRRPRPKELWPVDALELAAELLLAGLSREPACTTNGGL